MDYSQKGILTMLQDLQRIYFGIAQMTVNTYIMDDGTNLVVGTVFDRQDDPHTFNFFSFVDDNQRKEEYLKVLGVLDSIDGRIKNVNDDKKVNTKLA